MKKTAVTLVSLLAVGSALAGCGSKEAATTPAPTSTPVATKAPEAATPAPSKAPEKVTLNLRNVLVKETQAKELARLQQVKKDVEAKVPGLTIEMVSMEEQAHRLQRLPAEFAQGNPPEIFQLFGGSDTKKFSKTGSLLDLTPIITELGLKDKFYDLGEFTVDGKIYGLPLAGYQENVFYNKKIFADNGLQIPKTWDELMKVCETLKAKGIQPFAFGAKDAWAITMPMNTLWVRYGGKDITAEIQAGTKKWTDPGVVEGFKKFKELIDKGYVTKNSLALSNEQGYGEFQKGNAAMRFDGTWAGGAFTDPKFSKVTDDVGFFQFPNVGGPGDNIVNASYSSGYGYSSKVNDAQKAAIKEFIKRMYSDEEQLKQNADEGWLPAKKITIDSAKPYVKEVFAVAGAAKGSFPAFDAEVPTSVRDFIFQEAQKLVGGKVTAEQFAENVQKAQEKADKEKK
ncbi:extracellular solute-binding protein [Paenibacillus sp. N1-5-1-14]|uniref:ABC transporter substrate-binding protein n=1 Tax=Paenibacillus radicibacter TaxID=2972488 RepID=UPI0021591FC9|nr:extracellular solute-binding protein [Paenibacillus radicibacter]MCR8644059.1 extracellular solute-binding protein [Paenibacillus radicibacter]